MAIGRTRPAPVHAGQRVSRPVGRPCSRSLGTPSLFGSRLRSTQARVGLSKLQRSPKKSAGGSSWATGRQPCWLADPGGSSWPTIRRGLWLAGRTECTSVMGKPEPGRPADSGTFGRKRGTSSSYPCPSRRFARSRMPDRARRVEIVV
jgi:hypothetical protein